MGWGVFASKSIRVGTVITTNIADAFSHAEWSAIKHSFFGPFVFMNKEDYAKGIMNGFVAWGMITKVNHADSPNATVETTERNGHLEAILRATKPINSGEQIFIRYTNRVDYDFTEKRPA